ncbi:MAG TPA: DMT family transporter [Anaeromyxobacteraceae bacterium]|nr:DMT family transporter [Anaeromyxobacteraceae bacterium]
MRPFVAILALASAFLHALWNAALKRQRDPEAASVAIIAAAVVFAAGAIPLAGPPSFTTARAVAWSISAGLFEGGYFATLALSMREAPLAVAYTIARGGALVAVWPASVLWLGEGVTGPSALGALAVGSGLVLLGSEHAGVARARGVLWAGACALFVAGYHVSYKCALGAGAEPTALFAVALGLALPINLARLGPAGLTRIRSAIRGNGPALAAAGALCTASFLLFLAALARGGAGTVMTLRNASVVFALLLAYAIGERPSRRQVAGTAVVALGALLLAWPA